MKITEKHEVFCVNKMLPGMFKAGEWVGSDTQWIIEQAIKHMTLQGQCKVLIYLKPCKEESRYAVYMRVGFVDRERTLDNI